MSRDQTIAIRLNQLNSERKLLTDIRTKLMKDRNDLAMLSSMFDQFFKFKPSVIDGHNTYEDNDPVWPSDDSDPKKETESKFTDRMESKLHLEQGTLSEHFTRQNDPFTAEDESGYTEIKSRIRQNVAQVATLQSQIDSMQAEIADLTIIQENEPTPSK